MRKVILLTVALLTGMQGRAGVDEDTLASRQYLPSKRLSVDLILMTRGEMRNGGMLSTKSDDDITDKTNFVLGRSRLIMNYSQSLAGIDAPYTPTLEARLTTQQTAIWGDANSSGINVFEAWAKLSNNGLFAQVGRVALAYDDERIIGLNDWAMAAQSHDVLRLGYEGNGHKAHAILAYNQKTENMNKGGTYYTNGSQPYKTMQALWYHYDVPRLPLGASLLFMNSGMQAGEKDKDARTEYQQVWGGFLSFKPKNWLAEASYYRQTGNSEYGIKIKAWMASAKLTYTPSWRYSLTAGFDYLSGDKYFAVPPKGALGLIRQEVIGGFNSIYGSHHKFYGAIDFFYIGTYVNGFTPGLQNLYFSGTYNPTRQLSFQAAYHYMAMATSHNDWDRTLGHEIELEGSYRFLKEAKLSAGFSFMTGTGTMEKLKRASDDGSLRWAWLSLTVSPTIFTARW